MWWELGATANGVLLASYMVIALSILLPLVKSDQLRSNHLGAATAAIFFTCGIGHGLHLFHLVAPSLGVEQTVGEAARRSVEWHMVFWDSLTALIGLYYVSLRKTYGSLMKGAALFDDMKAKQRQALEIHDNIVQGLIVAETALALDEHDVSRAALESTLAAARQIISELLGEVGSEVRLGPGDLRRSEAAMVKGR